MGESGIWPTVQIVKVRHAPVTEKGETLAIRIDAQGQIDGTRHISLRLVNAEGMVLSQADNPMLGETRPSLAIPADAPAGAYTLAAIVYDPNTLASIPNAIDQHLAPISTIEIR